MRPYLPSAWVSSSSALATFFCSLPLSGYVPLPTEGKRVPGMGSTVIKGRSSTLRPFNWVAHSPLSKLRHRLLPRRELLCDIQSNHTTKSHLVSLLVLSCPDNSLSLSRSLSLSLPRYLSSPPRSTCRHHHQRSFALCRSSFSLPFDEVPPFSRAPFVSKARLPLLPRDGRRYRLARRGRAPYPGPGRVFRLAR